jgi:hypothetical protein
MNHSGNAMKTLQVPNTESAIWDRLFQPVGKTLSLQAARSILTFEFSDADKERMHELAAKARDGALTSAEEFEIRIYERAGNVLALWKSKARQRLKKASYTNGAKYGRGNGSRS